MRSSILRSLLIFVLGIAGGIFGSQILWPLLVERPLFYQYNLEQIPMYINERKEIVVQENTALVQGIAQGKKNIIGIRTITSEGKIFWGSGLVLTSDGFIVTLNELLPKGAEISFVFDGEKLPYEVLKRDPESNLALVLLKKSGLSAAGFVNLSDELKLGQRVFFVAYVERKDEKGFSSDFAASEGIVRRVGEKFIETDIFEENFVRGSPLFTVDGKVIGLNTVDRTGRVIAIPNTIIRQFTGF